MPHPRLVTDVERRARLVRRQLLGPSHRAAGTDAVLDVARAMTCLHATEPANVHLAVAARSGATRAAVDAALYERRSLVKQLAMRRTLFAFPRELLPAVWGSASARVAAQQRARLAKDVEASAITEDGAAWVEATTGAVLATLTERGPLTTAALRGVLPEMGRVLTSAPGAATGATIPVASRVLTTLAADGSVLRGDNDGGWKTSRPLWTTTGQWLGETPAPLEAAAGYARLVEAWLHTFGPGTEEDLVWWLGATKAAVRAALATLDAVPVALEGTDATGWLAADDAGPVAPVEPEAALLPVLDPTTMGWKGRTFYLGGHAGALFDRNGNGGATAWWDGRVVGGWHQRSDGGVVVDLLDDLPAAARAALEAEAERLSAWLDGDVVRSVYASPLARQRAAAAVADAG